MKILLFAVMLCGTVHADFPCDMKMDSRLSSELGKDKSPIYKVALVTDSAAAAQAIKTRLQEFGLSSSEEVFTLAKPPGAYGVEVSIFSHADGRDLAQFLERSEDIHYAYLTLHHLSVRTTREAGMAALLPTDVAEEFRLAHGKTNGVLISQVAVKEKVIHVEFVDARVLSKQRTPAFPETFTSSFGETYKVEVETIGARG